MSPWHELEVGRHRIRWRKKEGEFANPASAYELEVRKSGEWREVRNWNSREWFWWGIEAARRLQEGEQGGLFK